ncbi:MAG: NAD(P)/FAD-dependent oxidoreductase [Ilumatobacteraceae bacterium]
MHELSGLSLWHSTMSDGDWGPTRAPLTADTAVDVVIVGGGYTGLWTAYYLLRRDPTMRVMVLEAEVVGFGASGRNGGWCSALLPMGLDAMAAASSRDAAVRMQRTMHEAVTEVGRVVGEEGIDCHFQQGGWLGLARSPMQLERSTEYIDHLRSYGFTEDDYRLLTAGEARERCGATKVVGGTFTPHCAAIHPARLARGLAVAVERRGGVIHEHTRVERIEPHRVVTSGGNVTAEVVVRATEAFTPRLPGEGRTVAPIYSLMVATEPLSPAFWREAGLADRATFNDGRHMIVYGQRTADDRLAFGGRGAPYHFGSKMSPAFDRNDGVKAMLHQTLREMFPSLGDAAITHHWGGAVAAPRDWWCSVTFDRASGLATAGGYVGDGVGTTNLSGRTLADLITDEPSDLTSLPWVGHRSRKWEPEPLRWLGINTMVRLPVSADQHEERKGTPARVRNALVSRLTGH